MDIRVQLLGPFVIEVSGRRVQLGRLRQRALVAVLALNAGEAHSTDQLTRALWGEQTPASPRSALQTAVSHIRASLDDAGQAAGVLQSVQHGYLLCIEADQVDSGRLETLVGKARALLDEGQPRLALKEAQAALSLSRGTALVDFVDLPFAILDGPRLDELSNEARELAARSALELGEPSVAVSELRPLVAAHPWRESAVELQMLALYRSGRQVEALRAYSELRERLAEQAGLLPNPRLRQLEAAILAHDPSLDGPIRHAAHGPAPATAPTSSSERSSPPPALRTRRRVPLAGRARELEQVRAAWTAVGGGHRRALDISGEPGMGKTRLASELAVEARLGGGVVLAGRCRRHAAVPYQPIVEALTGYLSEHGEHRLLAHAGQGAAELSRMLPTLLAGAEPAPAPMAADDPDNGELDRFRLFEAVAGTITSMAQEGPVMLAIDDAQWADPSTLLMLRHLLWHPEACPLLVTFTRRIEPTAIQPALTDLLAEVEHDGALDSVSLEGLGADDVGELIRRQSGHTPTDEFVDAIRTETRGNPFFVEEVVGQLMADEDHAEPLSNASVLARVGRSAGVDSLINTRVSALGPVAREVVSALSLTVVSVDAATMSEALHRHRDEVIAGLAEAASVHLVTEDEDRAGLILSHPLVREAVAASIPGITRAQLHEGLAVALEGRQGTPAGALAHHWYGARSIAGPGPAARYAEAAGDDALHQFAYEEAAPLYRRALELLGGDNLSDQATKARLLLRLCESLALSGELDEVPALAGRTIDAARSAGRASWQAEAALILAGPATLRLPDPNVVTALRRAIDDLGEEDPAMTARLLARLAMEHCFEDFGLAEALSQEAVTTARKAGDRRTLIHVLGNRHWILGPDRLDEQSSLADEMVDLARAAGEQEEEVTARHYRLLDRLAWGDISGVAHEQASLDAMTAKLRQPRYLWQAAVFRAMRALLAGELERAEELAAEAMAMGQRGQAENALAAYAAQLFVIRMHQGRLDELEEALRGYAAAFPFVPAWRAAHALSLARTERADEAGEVLTALSEGGFSRIPRDTNWLVALSLIGDTVAALGEADMARDLLALLNNVPGRCVVVGAGFACLGSIDRVLGELATTVGHWASAEASFRAAIATHRGMKASAWLAATESGYVRLLRRRARPGDEERAVVLLDEVETAIATLGLGATP